MFIYLDESGDLGFDFVCKRPSQKFIITLLVCDSKMAVDAFKTAVKRTLRNKLNHKKDSKNQVSELHAVSLSLPIKQYFYRQIKNQDWKIYTVSLLSGTSIMQIRLCLKLNIWEVIRHKKDGPCYVDNPGTLANRWKGTY